MTKDRPALTAQQRQICVSRLPEALRAAVMDVPLTGFDVYREGVQTEELCHPLTKEQLAQIRACTSFTRREMEVIPVPADGDALVFRIRHDVAGYDADGNAVAVQAEGVLGVTCCLRGGGIVAITDAFPCRMLADGRVKQPGWLAHRMRRWLRRRNRVSVGETAGEILLELLGAVVELALEALFDG